MYVATLLQSFIHVRMKHIQPIRSFQWYILCALALIVCAPPFHVLSIHYNIKYKREQLSTQKLHHIHTSLYVYIFTRKKTTTHPPIQNVLNISVRLLILLPSIPTFISFIIPSYKIVHLCIISILQFCVWIVLCIFGLFVQKFHVYCFALCIHTPSTLQIDAVLSADVVFVQPRLIRFILCVENNAPLQFKRMRLKKFFFWVVHNIDIYVHIMKKLEHSARITPMCVFALSLHVYIRFQGFSLQCSRQWLKVQKKKMCLPHYIKTVRNK